MHPESLKSKTVEKSGRIAEINKLTETNLPSIRPLPPEPHVHEELSYCLHCLQAKSFFKPRKCVVY
jgi:hypothetical protein